MSKFGHRCITTGKSTAKRTRRGKIEPFAFSLFSKHY
jgi:hypothetical protein